MAEIPAAFPEFIDLAVEAADCLRGNRQTEIPGVRESIYSCGSCTIRRIHIFNTVGAEAMQRPLGSYYTLQTPPLYQNDAAIRTDAIHAIVQVLSSLIKEKVHLSPTDGVLFVGLGNAAFSADALGTQFISACPVTRHLTKYAPDALAPNIRPCCSIAPGVMGSTGLEALEILQGIIQQSQPALLVAVDSLCAQNPQRIGCTLQLSGNGIQPGSGLGQHRKALNQQTLGIPVIAIGCPTMIHADTLVRYFLENSAVSSSFPAFDAQQLQTALHQTFAFYGSPFFVIPKDIEAITYSAARIIAAGVRQVLFPQIPAEQLDLYVPAPEGW